MFIMVSVFRGSLQFYSEQYHFTPATRWFFVWAKHEKVGITYVDSFRYSLKTHTRDLFLKVARTRWNVLLMQVRNPCILSGGHIAPSINDMPFCSGKINKICIVHANWLDSTVPVVFNESSLAGRTVRAHVGI